MTASPRPGGQHREQLQLMEAVISSFLRRLGGQGFITHHSAGATLHQPWQLLGALGKFLGVT